MKNQNRQNMKPTQPILKKLNSQELDNFKTGYQNLQKVTNDLKSLCYNKEKALRKIEADFNKNYDHLSFSLENIDANYKKTLKELQAKYGTDVSFNLQTGEIQSMSKPIISDQTTEAPTTEAPNEEVK